MAAFTYLSKVDIQSWVLPQSRTVYFDPVNNTSGLSFDRGHECEKHGTQ